MNEFNDQPINELSNTNNNDSNNTILTETQQQLINEIRNRPNGSNIVLNRTQYQH